MIREDNDVFIEVVRSFSFGRIEYYGNWGWKWGLMKGYKGW